MQDICVNTSKSYKITMDQQQEETAFFSSMSNYTTPFSLVYTALFNQQVL